MNKNLIRSAKPRAVERAVLNWAQPAPHRTADLTTARRPPVKSTARPPVESGASKPFTKFLPGPWTAQLLMIANPGMPAREALRLTATIDRSHAAAASDVRKSGTTRLQQAAKAVVPGACA